MYCTANNCLANEYDSFSLLFLSDKWDPMTTVTRRVIQCDDLPFCINYVFLIDAQAVFIFDNLMYFANDFLFRKKKLFLSLASSSSCEKDFWKIKQKWKQQSAINITIFTHPPNRNSLMSLLMSMLKLVNISSCNFWQNMFNVKGHSV